MADRILISLLVVLSLSGIIFIKTALPKGNIVRIESAGKLVYLLSLDENRTVPVQGPEGSTVIEIKDHMVRIADSPCSNKLCVKQGWIKSGSIVCLPNRIVVTIDNSDGNKTTDAITG